ncbi:MAG: CYCXC family (seleno)protein [Candidatus Binataceae bacterium]
MLTGTKGTLAIIAGLLVMAAGAYVWFGSPHSSADATEQISAPGDAATNLRLTLDPKLFQGEVREAYEVAERDPALLAQLHCYCGCDKSDGHKSLLDCYRDKHGSTCAICVGEAREAEVLAKQGMPVEQIRDSLRNRFGHGD